MLKLFLLVLISAGPGFAQYHSGTITAKRIVLSTGTSEIGTIGFSTVAAQQSGSWAVVLSSGTNMIGSAQIIGIDGNIAKIDTSGRLYVNNTISAPSYFGYDTGIIAIGAKDSNRPAILLVNESTNTIQAALQELKAAMVTTNAYTIVRTWLNPIVESSGTAVIPVTLTGATPAKLKLYTFPTASGTSVVDSHFINLNSNMVTLPIGGSIVLRPGNKLLFTGYSGTNNTEYIFNIKWTEEPYTP